MTHPTNKEGDVKKRKLKKLIKHLEGRSVRQQQRIDDLEAHVGDVHESLRKFSELSADAAATMSRTLAEIASAAGEEAKDRSRLSARVRTIEQQLTKLSDQIASLEGADDSDRLDIIERDVHEVEKRLDELDDPRDHLDDADMAAVRDVAEAIADGTFSVLDELRTDVLDELTKHEQHLGTIISILHAMTARFDGIGAELEALREVPWPKPSREVASFLANELCIFSEESEQLQHPADYGLTVKERDDFVAYLDQVIRYHHELATAKGPA